MRGLRIVLWWPGPMVESCDRVGCRDNYGCVSRRVRSSAARSRPAADRRLRDAHQVRAWPESPPIQDIVVQRRDRTVTACANRPALDSHVTRGMDVGEAAGIIYRTASPEVALSRETAGGRSLDPDNSRVGIIGEARRRSPRRRPISCGNRPFRGSLESAPQDARIPTEASAARACRDAPGGSVS